MFRRSFVPTGLFLFAVFVLGSPVFAQTGSIRGKVMLVNADGSKTPFADAVIEAYRTDLDSGGATPTKTNKTGEFALIVPVGRKYALIASGAGLSPGMVKDISAGMENVEILVSPGDGKSYTEAEVREALKRAATEKPQTPEELKKAKEEYDKQVAKYNEEKAKAENTNKIVNDALKAGNEAFAAKNFDLAISKYNEGIAADPEFIGSAPIFYNNKGAAFRSNAVEIYNNAVKITDAAEKASAMGRAKKALANSAESYAKAFNLLKNASAAEIKEQPNYDGNKMTSLAGAVETFKMAVRTQQVDTATVEASKQLIPEYLAVEKDAAKKSEASLVTADLYRIVEDRENAIAAYKKVLETSPENVDALAYLGIVLVDLGWLKDNDKTLSQEGANYLQKFVSIAPDTHALKDGAVEYLGILKTQNIIPVKTTTPRKRP